MSSAEILPSMLSINPIWIHLLYIIFLLGDTIAHAVSVLDTLVSNQPSDAPMGTRIPNVAVSYPEDILRRSIR